MEAAHEEWSSEVKLKLTLSKPRSNMKVPCRAASLLLSMKKSKSKGDTASGCVVDVSPQLMCHWSR